MATESPLLVDSNTVLSTAADARRSSITGSTLPGPNGSGQFLAVVLSTTVSRTVQFPSTVSGQFKAFGILQNTPAGGQAAAVGFIGTTKVVAGSSSINPGTDLQLSSTSAGVLVPFSSAAGATPCARSIESATAVGQVFTATLYGLGGPPGGV